LNAAFITMYYVTILAWVCGMLLGTLGPLWTEATALPAFGIDSLPNPVGFFFSMLSSGWVLVLVAVVWLLNAVIVRRGIATIESAVKVFVPLMWLFMGILIVRGITLPHGEEGVYLLFTPDFQIARDPGVWQGAMSQIFFSLSLGFGIMTAYGSYLPKDADHANNGIVTACLNCGFEFLAGLAVFSLLFAFAIVPQASTLGMMFFVVPQGIAAMPAAVKLFGFVFFLLLLMAGLSSSISLLEAICSAVIDKFGWSRKKTLTIACGIGILGSSAFALPQVIDRGLASNGTLGLTLLDLIDHWAFSYGLLVVGLVECLIIGWLLPASRLRQMVNANSRFRLPAVFDWLLKVVIPLGLLAILATSLWGELTGAFYGTTFTLDWANSLPVAAALFWIGSTIVGAWFLTSRRGVEQPRLEPAEAPEVPHAS
jgi:NSS family neurotransmitter:Na+ symporter